MGTSDPKPLTHGGISEAAAISLYGPEAARAPSPEASESVAEEQTSEDPWDRMFTHAQIDVYMDEHRVMQPSGWNSKTVQQKKDWLDEKYSGS